MAKIKDDRSAISDLKTEASLRAGIESAIVGGGQGSVVDQHEGRLVASLSNSVVL